MNESGESNAAQAVKPSGRGGARPGAGRPRELRGRRQSLTVHVLQKHLRIIRAWQRRHGCKSLGAAVREIVEAAREQ